MKLFVKKYAQRFAQMAVDQIWSQIPYSKPKNHHMNIVAHRGAHYHNDSSKRLKENSMKAFQRAVDLGVAAIEFDIQPTKDNQLVVNHDHDLRRVHNIPKNISDLSLKELQAICPDVPTFENLVNSFKGKIKFFIELKVYVEPQGFDLNKSLSSTLSSLRPLDDFYFLCLKPKTFKKLSHFPEESFLPVATTNIDDLKPRADLDFPYGGLTGHYLLMKQDILDELHQRNKLVGTGQIPGTRVANRELNRKVDWLFTDRPQKLIQHLS